MKSWHHLYNPNYLTSIKYFNIDTKIFWLTRHQQSEFLTVLNTDFAYHLLCLLFAHQLSSVQSQCFISALLIHTSHTKTQIKVYRHTFKKAKHFTLPAIQQHWFDLWNTKKTLPSGTEVPLHFSIAHVVSWSTESNTRTAMGLRTNGCRVRSPAIKCVTHNNPRGSFLFNSTFENWLDNKQRKALTMDYKSLSNCVRQ